MACLTKRNGVYYLYWKEGGKVKGKRISKDYQTAKEAIKLIRKAVNLANQAGVHYYIVRTVIDLARIVLSLTIENLNTFMEQDLEFLNKQINEVLRTSEESGYKLIEAEAFFVRAYMCLLKNDHIQARKEMTYAINLARDLKYRWLENKCSCSVEKLFNK